MDREDSDFWRPRHRDRGGAGPDELPEDEQLTQVDGDLGWDPDDAFGDEPDDGPPTVAAAGYDPAGFDASGFDPPTRAYEPAGPADATGEYGPTGDYGSTGASGPAGAHAPVGERDLLFGPAGGGMPPGSTPGGPDAPDEEPGGAGPTAVLAAIAGVVVAAACVAGIVLVARGGNDQTAAAPSATDAPAATAAPTPSPTAAATPEPTSAQAGAVPDYAAASGTEISERGVRYRLPSGEWSSSDPVTIGKGLYTRTLTGPGGEQLVVYLSPASPAAPGAKYVQSRTTVDTPSSYPVERAVLDGFPTDACRDQLCDDYLVSAQEFGGVAVLASDTGGASSAAALSVAASVAPSAGQPPSDASAGGGSANGSGGPNGGGAAAGALPPGQAKKIEKALEHARKKDKPGR